MKKKIYSNLNTNVLTKNRTFRKTGIPFLADKTKKFQNNFNRGRGVYFSKSLNCKTFNKYFISVPIKNMRKNQEYESLDLLEENPDSGIQVLKF